MLSFFQRIFQFPAVCALLFIVLIHNLTAVIVSERINFLPSLYKIEDKIFLVSTLLFIAFLGPHLEKIYGSVVFIFLFTFPAIIGGIFNYIFSISLTSSPLATSIASLVSIFTVNLIKRIKCIKKGMIIWLLSSSIFIYLSFYLHLFDKHHMITGFVIGICLAIVVKPKLSLEKINDIFEKISMKFNIGLIIILWILISINGQIHAKLPKKDTHEYQQEFKDSKQASVNFSKTSAMYQLIYNAMKRMDSQVYLGTYTTNRDEVFAVLQQVLNEHPDIFYFDYASTYFLQNGILTLGYSYSKTEVRLLQDQLKQKVKDIFSNYLTPNQDEYKKVKVIHDYVVTHTAYDYEQFLAGTVPVESHSIVGTLLYGQAVCDGYAKTMQYLLNQIGIETIYVTGKGRGGGHAWNKVKIDGVWYNVDATWNDSIPDKEGGVSYQYFLVTDHFLAIDHQWEQTGLPVANDTKYMVHNF